MLILGIETSGKIASCAVFESEKCSVLGEFTIKTEKTHSQIILPMCEKLLAETEFELQDINAVAISKGPGSYTGIRIGISAAKAICYALNKKCCGVSELYSLAVRTNVKSGLVCSIIKARQDLVYAAVYRDPLSENFEVVFSECIVKESKLDEFLKTLDEKIVFTGVDSEEFVKKFECGNYEIADISVREQNASSLCRAALYVGFGDADDLNASYLQLTEAERNLKNKE